MIFETCVMIIEPCKSFQDLLSHKQYGKLTISVYIERRDTKTHQLGLIFNILSYYNIVFRFYISVIVYTVQLR